MEHIVFTFISCFKNYLYLWYFFLFLIVFFENIILVWYFIPWTITVVIFWMLAGLWYYNFYTLIIIATLWNLIWSILSFKIWYLVWRKVLNKWFYFIKSRYLKKLSVFFNKNAWGRSIFLWKLIPWLKENIEFVAWVLHIKFYVFLIWSLLWSIMWAIIYIWLWDIFFSSYKLAQIWIWRVSFILFILLFIFIFLLILRIIFVKLWRYFILISLNLIKLIRNNIKKTKLFKKYPKLYIFIENRFKLSEFTGLPLTIFLFILWYFISWFVWFINVTFDNPIMRNIDFNVSNLMHYFNYNFWIKLFIVISFFWSPFFIYTLVLFLSLYFLINKKINVFFSFLITIFSTSIVVFLTKYIVHRPRPELAIYFINSYSFPSFYSSISVAFYWFLIWLLIRNVKNWRIKVNLFILFLLIIFLIWFSSIYLNVNYVSDVLWWYLVGWIWFVLWITMFEYIYHITKWKSKKYKKLSFFKKIIFIWLILSCSSYLFSFYIKNLKYLDKKNNEKTIYITNIINYFNKHPKLKYTETIAWRETNPINFIFLSKNNKNIKDVFLKAGFTSADRITFHSIKQIWISLYDKIPYYKAPMLPLYRNWQLQNFSFQKVENPKNIRLRHHIRIWKTNLKIWKYNIYVASAVYDDWIKWHITHKISPNLDKERNWTLRKLKKTWLLKNIKFIHILPWYIGYNFSYDKFFTDGNVYILTIN